MFESIRRDEFWWSSITGPRMFVSGAVEALLEGKLVVLKVPQDLPWRGAMRSAVCNAFQERSDAEIAIEFERPYLDMTAVTAPGRQLLSRFASGAVRDGYRQSSRQTLPEYVRASGVLRGYLIWVEGCGDNDAAERWLDFCQDFVPGSADAIEEGLFVVEVDDSIKIPERRNMKVLNFEDFVNRYDVQVFNSFIVDELDNDYSDDWKRYISTLAASLCEFDAEVSECLLRTTDFTKEDPIEGVRRIANSAEFASRKSCEVLRRELAEIELEPDVESDEEVFVGNGVRDPSELRRRIWSAQVQVLYPLLELERVQWIRRYWSWIEEALESNVVYRDYSSTERLRDPMDLEFGTLFHMMSTPRSSDGFFILYIPESDERGRIRFFRDCRNRLSHRMCCRPSQVARLLGGL